MFSHLESLSGAEEFYFYVKYITSEMNINNPGTDLCIEDFLSNNNHKENKNRKLKE